MAGAGLKSTNINRDFTGFRAQQLQQAHQQLQKQQQQQQQQKQQQQQQQQQQQKNKQLKQQRRLNPALGWGRRGWAMLRNSKSKIARQEAPFDEYIPFTDLSEDKDPEDLSEEPDHSCHLVYRHNQFGITPAPNSWPLHLDDYHSPVKPQEYLKKRVELMRTFYEDRIPHYGQLEDVFKISVLVRNHVERTLQQAPQLTGEIRARDSYKASLIGTALARAALYSTVHAH